MLRCVLVQASGQVQRGAGRFRRRFRKALVQSPARFNEVPEKVLEMVPEGLGAKLGQVQRGFK
jgi:hypothetical protein